MNEHNYTCPDIDCKGADAEWDQAAFDEGIHFCQYCGKKLMELPNG